MTFTNFGRMVFSRCLVAGWAILIAGALNLAQAQYAPPPPPPPVPPPPPPVFNPSPSNTTVPQPSYKSISPASPSAVPGSEVTAPANETLPRTAARSHRLVRHHWARSTPVAYRCGAYGWNYYGCWRIYSWAFPCQYYSTYCDPYDYDRLLSWYRY